VTQLPNRINLYNSLASLNTDPITINLSGDLMIEENVDTGSSGSGIGSLTTDDETACDTHSYTLLPGDDRANFSIEGTDKDQLILKVGVLDFEAQPSYSVTVQSTDFFDGTPISQLFTVNVIDLNEAPSIEEALRDVDENAANSTIVGDPIPATDPDADSVLTYAIDPSSNTNGAFAIDENGQITVANSAALDLETTPVFSLTVQVTDNGGLSDSTVVTVNVIEFVPPPFVLTGSLGNDQFLRFLGNRAISESDVNERCADGDGCRITLTRVHGTSTIVYGPINFSYNSATKRWTGGNSPGTGINGSEGTAVILGSAVRPGCYFSDWDSSTGSGSGIPDRNGNWAVIIGNNTSTLLTCTIRIDD
jgi:hypothetical protein